MKKYKKLISWFIIITLLVLCVFYLFKRQKSLPNNEVYYTFDMQSSYATGKLGIQSKELNSQTLLQGILCIDHASNLSKVDLFMPDMGHGSSPPVLSKASNLKPPFNMDSEQQNDFGCFNISKMELFMPGLWQVRVFYKNGEQGYFEVNLEN